MLYWLWRFDSFGFLVRICWELKQRFSSRISFVFTIMMIEHSWNSGPNMLGLKANILKLNRLCLHRLWWCDQIAFAIVGLKLFLYFCICVAALASTARLARIEENALLSICNKCSSIGKVPDQSFGILKLWIFYFKFWISKVLWSVRCSVNSPKYNSRAGWKRS